MRKVWYACILSVFIHLLLAEGIRFIPVLPPQTHETVEIEIKPSTSQNKTRQIVRQSLVPESLKVQESEDPTELLSAESQRVKKQMRAAQSGKTENRANQMNSRSQRAEMEKPNKALPKVDKDALIASAREAGGHMGMPPLNQGVSTIGEALPNEVQIGSFTALNTDRYLFYSFYARIEDLIRYRWESSVERAINTIPRERFQASVNNRWVTQIEVLLNAKGNFQRVLMMKPSGLPAFDQAAAQAFAQARYFPNPPKEMVEEDGLIHLKYSFTVQFDPRLLAQP